VAVVEVAVDDDVVVVVVIPSGGEISAGVAEVRSVGAKEYLF